MKISYIALCILASSNLAALCTKAESAQESEELKRFYAVKETRKSLLASKSCPGCDLFQAQLGSSQLWGANLEGAYLKGADFNSADLREANLKKAVLVRADFSTDVKLQRADLTEADLTGANLGTANLNGTIFCRTKMPDGSMRNDNCTN